MLVLTDAGAETSCAPQAARVKAAVTAARTAAIFLLNMRFSSLLFFKCFCTSILPYTLLIGWGGAQVKRKRKLFAAKTKKPPPSFRRAAALIDL